MKYFLFLFCLGCNTLFCLGQSRSGVISGSVTDSSGTAVVAASLTLMSTSNSGATNMTAGAGGKFIFNELAGGKYLLTVTAVGYDSFKSDTISLDSTHKLHVIRVNMSRADHHSLAVVTVSSKRPLIRQELDKTIIDVSVMIGSAASNTLEVLEKAPGVTVSPNGDISLNGRGGVLVMINGRTNYMSGPDLAAYLKSLPGGLVEKIELIENPSARYEASGNAIINIKLKKNITAGFTGTIQSGYSQGKNGRANDALNLSYLHNKLSIFASVSYNAERNYTNDNYERTFYTANNKVAAQQSLVNMQQNQLHGMTINFGMDYAVSTATTIGFIVNKNQSRRDGQLNSSNLNYDENIRLDSIGSGKITDIDKRTNWATNFNLLHKLKKTGGELSADLNYLRYKTRSTQHSQNNFSSAGGNATGTSAFSYLLPSDINIYTAKIDYSQPLQNRYSVEAGLRSSVVSNDNVANFFNVNGTVSEMDDARSNHFKYSENINAAYVNGRKSWERFSAQIGVRFENTRAVGKQLGNGSVAPSRFTKNYSKLFPSMFISYKLDTLDRNTLTFSITQRIARPNYQLLNPFVYYRDKYTYTSGNPFLNPQYQQRYEIRLQHKQFLRIGLSYNRFTQSIFQVTETVGNSFVSKPDNIAGGYMLLLNTSLSVAPAPWWNLNSDILLSRVGLKGDGANENLNFNAGIARLNLVNQFRFKKGWSAELGGYYASSDFNGQTRTRSMFRANTGVQKKFWKDKAAISLTVADIFHSWKYRNRSEDLKQASFYQTSESDTQRLGLSFTYRFGKDIFKNKRNHVDNASDEEKTRTQ